MCVCVCVCVCTHKYVLGDSTTGLAGGSASGKTSLAMRIIETLGVPWVSLLSMDSFYRVLSEEEHERAARNEYNFDHPGWCTYTCSGRNSI